KAGKKESTGHRLNRPCQPCATLSSNSSLGYHRSDARTAENGFATSSGVSKSAKVVLVPRNTWMCNVENNGQRGEDCTKDGGSYVVRLWSKSEDWCFVINWRRDNFKPSPKHASISCAADP